MLRLRVRFIDVEEPDSSDKRLKEFEAKYGLPSEYFFSLYEQGLVTIDPHDADQWAFQFEINREAKRILAGDETREGDSPPSSYRYVPKRRSAAERCDADLIRTLHTKTGRAA